MHETTDIASEPVRRLLSSAAVRERARMMLALADRDELLHFSFHPERLEACAALVAETTRAAYPDLAIPFHARWRHFGAGGLDRWGALAEAIDWPDSAERARAAFDLVVVSVLLDAGAGPEWRYLEGRTGETYTRSEGLAVASLDMFVSGLFSARREDPFRVDAEALAAITTEDLASGFQAGPDNPMVGLEGRAALLRRLGHAIAADQAGFPAPRPGALFDVLRADAVDGRLPASAVLERLLLHLGPIWPGRIAVGGIALGDTWRHPRVRTDDATDGLVPFHKLSQWLAYSLLEPLAAAGVAVVGVDELTGLPEYRNGGLFLDTGVLALKDPADAERVHAVDSVLVVEWRALTVALLDLVAERVRTILGRTPETLPLARVLEGGTWATGRRLAAQLRDGRPPLRVASDGTVF